MNTHLFEESKVILVNPPALPYWYKTECLGIGYLAGVLRKNRIPFKIIDAYVFDIDIKSLIKIVEKIRFISIVGFTIPSFEALKSSLIVSYEIKQRYPKIHICLGGHFPTFWYREIFESFHNLVDSIVISEGEETFLELAQKVNNGKDWKDIKGIAYYDSGKVVFNPGRCFITDLNSLPFPERVSTKEIVRQGFPVVINSSRGCMFNCSFCQIQKFYKLQIGQPYRVRCPENVADEIEYLTHNFGASTFFFVDDNFIIGEKGKERAYEIAREIIKRRLRINLILQCLPSSVEKDLFEILKEAGLFLVYLGFESPIERILKSFRKPISLKDSLRAVKILSALGIQISPGIILYDTETSLDELKEAIKIFAKNPEMIPFDIHGLTILRGTDMEAYLEKEGRLIKQDFQLNFFIRDPQVELVRRILTDYRNQTDYYNLLFLLYKNLLSLNRNADLIKKESIKNAIAQVRTLNLFFLETLIDDIKKGSLDNLSNVFTEISKKLSKIKGELTK